MFWAARDCLNYLFWCLRTTCLQQWKNKKKIFCIKETFWASLLAPHITYRYTDSEIHYWIFKVIQLPECSRRMSVLPENAASFALCLRYLQSRARGKWSVKVTLLPTDRNLSHLSSRSSACSLWKLIWRTSDEDKTSKGCSTLVSDTTYVFFF